MEEKIITPTEYFDEVKAKKVKTSDQALSDFYESCLVLLNKYKVTGQKEGMLKLIFVIECIEKERDLVKLGVDTFVYKDDIEEYIDSVSKNTVKIIELENYEREIPDELVDTIQKTKDIFDVLYVVFTDYTGKVERKVEAERRVKDPILFGTFQDRENRVINDRFYYLGDWEDEYCDLTLDKMVNEVKSQKNKNIELKISTPIDINALKEELIAYKKEKDNRFRFQPINVERKSFISKVKSIFQ